MNYNLNYDYFKVKIEKKNVHLVLTNKINSDFLFK